MKLRNRKSYDITETQKWDESTSHKKRREEDNLLEDPECNRFRQRKSTKKSERDTSRRTTFKPTIIKVRRASRRSSQRSQFNYGKLVAAQSEAHRTAFQEAGVDHAPPPTWSYVRYKAKKYEIRLAHRAAFQEAGVDRPPTPTWSYVRAAAAKKNLRRAYHTAFEESGVFLPPSPTWSYRRAVAIEALRSTHREVPNTPSSISGHEEYLSLESSHEPSESFETSGYASLLECARSFDSIAEDP